MFQVISEFLLDLPTQYALVLKTLSLLKTFY